MASNNSGSPQEQQAHLGLPSDQRYPSAELDAQPTWWRQLKDGSRTATNQRDTPIYHQQQQQPRAGVDIAREQQMSQQFQ